MSASDAREWATLGLCPPAMNESASVARTRADKNMAILVKVITQSRADNVKSKILLDKQLADSLKSAKDFASSLDSDAAALMQEMDDANANLRKDNVRLRTKCSDLAYRVGVLEDINASEVARPPLAPPTTAPPLPTSSASSSSVRRTSTTASRMQPPAAPAPPPSAPPVQARGGGSQRGSRIQGRSRGRGQGRGAGNRGGHTSNHPRREGGLTMPPIPRPHVPRAEFFLGPHAWGPEPTAVLTQLLAGMSCPPYLTSPYSIFPSDDPLYINLVFDTVSDASLFRSAWANSNPSIPGFNVDLLDTLDF